MDVSHIFDQLNDAQRDAVAAPPGPMLVLAGAGSGKTRVLTHRVAWLVEAQQVSPLSILAVTFTNKASHEMRGRIEGLLGFPVNGMWMGTFHSIAHRFLRVHWREAGLEQGFQILDSDDQLRLIRRTLRQLNLDEGYWPPRQVQWYINAHKEEGRRPHHIPESEDRQQRELCRIYKTYEELCQRFSLVDFAELLLRTHELLDTNEPLRTRYQERFRHILVDEFQDTNSIQYHWLKLLAGANRNIFVVGDDDQSIYGWRGARVENILKFEKDFEGTTVVRLEQNYRSTGNILKAANAVIDHNRGRLGKNLWTQDDEGEPVKVYAAFNETDEARFVIDRIGRWVDAGNARRDVAILYRSNAQSRVFEEVLLDVGMPYRVYGGLRFFERAEIKDALAYLRLVSRRQDDPSFERVVNVPTRGIGNKTLDQVREYARVNQLSMWDAARALLHGHELSSRAILALTRFLELIDGLADNCRGLTLAEQVEAMLKASGLVAHHQKEKGEKAEARVENLEELVSAARNFEHDPEDGQDPLAAFLSHAALEAGEGQAEQWEDCIQLMSLHSAKGLEFPLVFLTGLEEGLFPHQRSFEEPGRLEEERRLCYVGMTRAMRELYLTYAEVRRLHGREAYTSPSRFLGEVPTDLVTEVRGGSALTRSGGRDFRSPAAEDAAAPSMRLGRHVKHSTFGDGVVLNIEGRGEYARVQVNFETVGSKWLVLAYANLEVV
ncbi:MAG: DNA helicase II [Gammaproteobacteria bacterium]|nr:DNA helicase II [Gammaproteobacteria bacterium]